MDERQLVHNAKNGDKDAFCSLYSLYKDRLYRYAFYRLGVREDAEDAVSDCVLSAFKQIERLKKPEAFSSWLFTILRYSCNAQLEHQSFSRKTADITELAETLSTDMTAAIDKTELQQALEHLKDEERDIVLMAVVLGLKSREIARITGLTAGAVRSKLSRSLLKMREFLGE